MPLFIATPPFVGNIPPHVHQYEHHAFSSACQRRQAFALNHLGQIRPVWLNKMKRMAMHVYDIKQRVKVISSRKPQKVRSVDL